MNSAITVHFQDRGQDFLEFDIRDRKVVAARPFQNDIWSGLEVLNDSICVGDYLAVRLPGGAVRTILYPVVDVQPLAEAVQIGPTDI